MSQPTLQPFFFNNDTNLYNHGQYFGFETEAFWKMFLECHDRNNNRGDFARDLEAQILLKHGMNPSTSNLYTHWGFHWKSVCPAQSPRYPTKWDCTRQTYYRLRQRCARHFGVDPEKIPMLPLRSPVAAIRKQAERREYFATRNVQQPINQDCDCCID